MLGSIEAQLEYHLQFNHYPPIDARFIPDCMTAISHCEDGELDMEIGMGNGITLTALEIVEQLHLDGFVNSCEW